jgi:hypothetical protein
METSIHQSGLETNGSTTVAISDLGSPARPVGPGGVPRLVSGVGAGTPSPGGVLGIGVRLSLLSWMDDLMRSCMNKPGGGCL